MNDKAPSPEAADLGSSYRDLADTWRMELVVSPGEKSDFTSDEEMQTAALLAVHFAGSQPPEAFADAARQQIVDQTCGAIIQARQIVAEMQQQTFQGLTSDSRVHRERILMAAALVAADHEHAEAYRQASPSERLRLLAQHARLSPAVMRHQVGPAYAALGSSLLRLYPAAAAGAIAEMDALTQSVAAESQAKTDSARNEAVANEMNSRQQQMAAQQQAAGQAEASGAPAEAPRPQKFKIPTPPASPVASTVRAHRARAAKLIWGGAGSLLALGTAAELLN